MSLNALEEENKRYVEIVTRTVGMLIKKEIIFLSTSLRELDKGKDLVVAITDVLECPRRK